MSDPITSSQVVDRLRWRYATKQFDPGRKISEADWSALEETLVLTPSSYGLQPWKFFFVASSAGSNVSSRRSSHDQRRLLAAKAEALGRKSLMELTAIVTLDTILRWHRQLWPRNGITGGGANRLAGHG